MMIQQPTRKPGILFLNMGKETIMPDIPPILEELKRTGAANVYEGNANPLAGDSILTALSKNGGQTNEFNRNQIDVIDLSGLRGALTLHNENGDLVYPYIIEAVKAIIEIERSRGHEIKTIPDFSQIEFLISKPRYFQEIEEAGGKLIPTKVLSAEKNDLEETINQAIEFMSETYSDKTKFVLKPGTSALAKGLVQLESPGKTGGVAVIPHEDTAADRIPIQNKQELRKFLKSYLKNTGTYKKQFMLQPFIPNLEISQVKIDGNQVYVIRIQGPTSIAHGNYDGIDLVLDSDSIPSKIRDFINDRVSSKLPSNMRSPYFLRTDIMIDLSTDDPHDNLNEFFQMDGDRSTGFLQLVYSQTGYDLTNSTILKYVQEDAVAEEKVTSCIIEWLKENNYLTAKKMVVAEFEGAGGSRLWRSVSTHALYSYVNMILNRAIPASMRPQMPLATPEASSRAGGKASTAKIEIDGANDNSTFDELGFDDNLSIQSPKFF